MRSGVDLVLALIAVILVIVLAAGLTLEVRLRLRVRDLLREEGPLFEEAALAPLLPEFDHGKSASRFGGMTFLEILEERRPLSDPALVDWQDKIALHRKMETLGVPRPALLFARSLGPGSGPELGRESQSEILEDLGMVLGDLCARGKDFVLKPAHLSESEGVVVVRDGVDLHSGRPAEPGWLLETAGTCLRRRAQDFENEALKLAPPGILIEERFPWDYEVKFFVVWGRVLVGKIVRFGAICGLWPTRACLGIFLRDGSRWSLPGRAGFRWVGGGRGRAPDYFGEMVAAAERLAAGSDWLRVDMMCSAEAFVVGEVAPYSASRLGSALEGAMAELLRRGYRRRAATLPASDSPPEPPPGPIE